jgi:hypothetical protein
MTMTRNVRRLALILMASGMLVGVGTSVATAGTGPNSFKATFSGSATLASQASATYAGSGSATRTGRITTNGNAVVTGPDDSCPGGNDNVNTETLTDNDGDTLTITSQDVGCPTGPYQYHGTGHWTVTEGTGRFQGATGQGSLDGHADFAAGTFDITLTGTLVTQDA